jgi:hypothetical protein
LWNVGLVLFIGGVFSVAGWVVYDASLDHGQLTDVGLRDSIIAELSNDDATLDPCISHDPKLVFHHTLIRLNATLSVLDATESMRRTDFDATESCSAAFLLVSSALITGCVSVCFGLGCLLGAVWLNNRQSKIAQVATVLQWLVLLVLVGMWGGALIFFSSVRARLRRLGDLSVRHSKSVLYSAFVWVRTALNDQKRRVPARAVARGATREKCDGGPRWHVHHPHGRDDGSERAPE